jgi:hypothetical protein
MSNEFDESYSVASTFIYKIPFLLLGIAVGMLVVWVALHWVPRALVTAVAAANQ